MSLLCNILSSKLRIANWHGFTLIQSVCCCVSAIWAALVILRGCWDDRQTTNRDSLWPSHINNIPTEKSKLYLSGLTYVCFHVLWRKLHPRLMRRKVERWFTSSEYQQSTLTARQALLLSQYSDEIEGWGTEPLGLENQQTTSTICLWLDLSEM